MPTPQATPAAPVAATCETCQGTERVTEFSCPECGEQFEIRVWEYDFGASSETGYRDAGVRARCKCGHEEDVEGGFERRVACPDCRGGKQ